MVVKLVVLLHLYQPPLQKDVVIKRVLPWYEHLFAHWLKHRQIKLSIAIAGGYLERVKDWKAGRLIQQIRSLASRGQLQFYATSPFGSFLPLLPKEVVEDELALNYMICQRWLGSVYRPVGLYAPLAAYSESLLKVVAKSKKKLIAGQGLVVDELCLKPNTDFNQIDYKKEYLEKVYGWPVFFNQRRMSDGLFFSPQIKKIGDVWPFMQPINVFVARADYFQSHGLAKKELFRDLLSDPRVETLFFTDLARKNPIKVELRAGSDQVWPSELKKGISFPTQRWPGNKLHAWQDQLAKRAIKLVYRELARDRRKKEGSGLSAYRRYYRTLSECLFYDQFYLLCQCRSWGISQFLSFYAAYKIKGLIEKLGNKSERKSAQTLYKKIILNSYMREKQDWFDKVVPQNNQKILTYRQHLIPNLLQLNPDQLAQQRERQERKEQN